jgi:membrane associated rhomboid family serine protease
MTASIIILSLTLTISFFGFRSDLIKYLLCLWPHKIYQIWRPFTYSFVHNSLSHLVGNTFFYCLGFLGLFQELSNVQFLQFYFLSVIISVVPTLLKKNEEFLTISGNSAFGFSIFFGMVAMDPHKIWGLFGYGLPVYYFGIGYLILSLIEGKLNKKISLSSHIVGAIVGITYVLWFLK